MDFSKNKDQILKQLSQKKMDHVAERRSIEAKNRMQEKAAGGTLRMNAVVVEKTNKPPLAIFGVKGLFITNLKSILQQYCEIYEFNEIDKATEFLMGNPVPVAIMDIDAPNNLDHCRDFFTTGKTVSADMAYIAYRTDDKPSEIVEVLQKQGAIIMQKPVDRMELIDLIKKVIAQWREKSGAAKDAAN